MPELHDILSPVDMLLDTIHFTSKLQARPTGSRHIGCTFRAGNAPPTAPISKECVNSLCLGTNANGILVKSKESRALPPSTSEKLLQICEKDAYALDLPAFELHPRVRKPDIISSAWEASIKLACVPLGSTPTSSQETDNPWAVVTISTVEHDNSQLLWKRSSKASGKPAPLCDFGEDCEALTIRGNQGCLPAYMTPSQQRLFDTTGEIPDGPHFCLLCMRRDAQALYLAYKTCLCNTQLQLGRQIFAIPPFQNICDAPGGYHKWAMGVQPETFMPLPVYIVGVSATLQCKYNPLTETWFIDQGPIVFGAQVPTPRDF